MRTRVKVRPTLSLPFLVALPQTNDLCSDTCVPGLYFLRGSMPSKGAELPWVFADLEKDNHKCMKLNTLSYLILYS